METKGQVMRTLDTRVRQERRPWKSPELEAVGSVADVLLGGGGKNSPAPSDPGEIRKPKGNAGEN
jgi:hypothetical protein